MGGFCSKESIVIKSRKYYVKELLGEGGFSTVYLVEDSTTMRYYAVKKIICHSADDEKIVLNEIRMHGIVNCDQVLKLIEHEKIGTAGLSPSYVYMLLPYFQRGTLLQELDRRGRSLRHYRPIEILELFLKICHGVKAFHDCQPPIAHRDLKTGNILLTNDHCPVIMDLGSAAVARVEVRNSAEAQALQDIASERCSMTYRAPELFHVEPNSVIDERTDIWSLGCILYALCFFKSPFDSVYEKGNSVALAVLNGNIYFSEGQVYSEEIESLIRYMLQVNPAERPMISSVIERTMAVYSNATSHIENPSI